MQTKSELFKIGFSKAVKKYHVEKHKQGGWIDSQRVAYLATIELVKLFGAKYGQDIECEFFNWSKKLKLQCNEIPSAEKNSVGKKKNIFPSSYWKLFENLNFKKFTSLAEEVLNPDRVPFVSREPVIRLFDCKKTL